MTWWLESPFPKPARGQDLLGEKLVLDPEKCPEDTKFPGMKSVFVKLVNNKTEPKQWIVYKVLMTDRDINTAIEAMMQKKTFTFDMSKSGQYPTVSLST